MKKIAILQSNYIPWKGYFDIIGKADIFIFHDDLQYTKGDWRNRNLIKTQSGKSWLTVPCGSNENRKINEVKIVDNSWQLSHWRKIEASYYCAHYFKYTASFLKPIYLERNWDNLSEMNQYIIKFISNEILNFNTKFLNSTEFNLKEKKSQRVLELLKKLNANYYLSGPSAKNYLDVDLFKFNKIEIEWMNYDDYKEYSQLFPPFDHNVSFIDMLMNLGPNTKEFMMCN
jgi:hypothetical protein